MNRNIATVKTKESLAREIGLSRSTLIIAAVCTLINLITVAAEADFMFPLSATIPYYFAILFYELCGMYPQSFYDEFWGGATEGFIDPTVFWVIFVLGILMALGCFVLGWFSTKKKVFSIITLVFYGIDTLVLLFFSFRVFSFSAVVIVELVFHAYLLYTAFRAVKAWDALASAPTAAEVAASMGYHGSTYGNPYGTSYGTVPTADEPVAEATAEETVTTVTTDAPEEAADTPAEVIDTPADTTESTEETKPE